MENFRQPYFAQSVREFWARWHISLSTWFRDYLYIPLGGNRVPFPRYLLNLMIVFVVSGLWHGASWTFVIWGGLHGLYIVVEALLHRRGIDVPAARRWCKMADHVRAGDVRLDFLPRQQLRRRALRGRRTCSPSARQR